MSNMSYCRFENTLRDLEDCSEHLLDTLSSSEDTYRTKMIIVCEEILASIDVSINKESLDKGLDYLETLVEED